MAIQQQNLIYQTPPGGQQQGVPANPPLSADVQNQIPQSASSTPPPTDSLGDESGFPLKSIFIKAGIGLGVIIVAIILVVFVILPIFSKSKENQNVTLTYWGLWEDENVMSQVISGYERENPNVKVEYKLMDSKQYRETLTTRILNGTGPDIFRFHNTWTPMLRTMGVIQPLSTQAITPNDFRKEFYPVMQKDLIHEGAIYGIPLHIDTLALFVNTKILQAAGDSIPKNWIEFVNTVKDTTTIDETGAIKTSGASMGSYDNVTHAPDIISLLMLQNGTDLYNVGGSSENAVTALQFYSDFVNNKPAVWDPNSDVSIKIFAQDKLAMYFGYSWDIFMIRSLNKDLSFTVNPVPTLPGNSPLTIASYWVEGVSSKTKNSKEAMKFMRFLSLKETEQKLYQEQVKSGRELIYPFLAQAENSTSSFFASDTHDGDNGINSRMNLYLKKTIDDIIGSNHTSVESSVDTLSNGTKQVLTDYGQ